MVKLFRKTLCIVTILLLLLSSLRVLRVSAPPPVKVDHDHQEEYEVVRYDDPPYNQKPVWFNVSADVWGYYHWEGQPYYRTNHSVVCDQGYANMTINDFRFLVENVTFYGLNLTGDIVYRETFNEPNWTVLYSISRSYEDYEDDVYLAYTYTKVKVWDKIEPEEGNATVSLTAWVNRRDDVAISNVTASPSEVNPGQNVNITVDVDNEGAVTKTFNVTIYRNDTAIETQTVLDLLPGNGTTLTFNWNTAGVKNGSYTIRAEASNVSGEWDTDDNTYTDGTVKVLNQPPNTPSKPSGPLSGYQGIEHTYFTNTTDLNGDDLYYQFKWGDDTNKTVGPFGSGENASAPHIWWLPGTYNVTVRAYDNYTWSEESWVIVDVTARLWYMQNAKWDSTYWKLFWNNTLTSTFKSWTKPGYYLAGYLGVKIYNGTTCISGASVIEVGRWYNLQSGPKNTTWNCTEEYNVTGTYIKVEIWHKFSGESWTYMNVAFKTETFTQNTILNATTWTIYLWGQHHILYGPLGPGWDNRSSTTFRWGSSSEESRIEDMIFTTG